MAYEVIGSSYIRSSSSIPFNKLKSIIESGDYPKSYTLLGEMVGGKPPSVVKKWLDKLEVDYSKWNLGSRIESRQDVTAHTKNYEDATPLARKKWDDAVAAFDKAKKAGNQSSINDAYKVRRTAAQALNSSARTQRKTIARQAARALGEEDLTTQAKKISENFNTFLKRNVTQGYQSWLKKNPQAVRTLADGTPLSSYKQAELWWEMLPLDQKNIFAEELFPVYDHNIDVMKKYHAMTPPRLAPSPELMQGHHLMPKAKGGGHFGAQIRAVLGNALTDPYSEHALLHRKELDPVYDLYKGQNFLPFDVDDPNLKGGKAQRLLGVLEDISGSGGGGGGGQNIWNTVKPIGQNIWNTVKPAAKVLGRASGILGSGMSIAQANEWRKSGNPNLATLATISASPNPLISAPAYLAELAGRFLNKEMDRERFPEGQQGWRQSLIDPNWRGDR